MTNIAVRKFKEWLADSQVTRNLSVNLQELTTDRISDSGVPSVRSNEYHVGKSNFEVTQGDSNSSGDYTSGTDNQGRAYWRVNGSDGDNIQGSPVGEWIRGPYVPSLELDHQLKVVGKCRPNGNAEVEDGRYDISHSSAQPKFPGWSVVFERDTLVAQLIPEQNGEVQEKTLVETISDTTIKYNGNYNITINVDYRYNDYLTVDIYPNEYVSGDVPVYSATFNSENYTFPDNNYWGYTDFYTRVEALSDLSQNESDWVQFEAYNYQFWQDNYVKD